MVNPPALIVNANAPRALLISRSGYRPAAWPWRIDRSAAHPQARSRHQAVALYPRHHGSDGNEEYGPDRLITHFLEPDACVEGLIKEVRRFGAGSDQTDDATAVLVRSR